ncbi:MAG: 50S ribosomal protein L25 [Dehalococcoidia bacterium]
MDIIELSADKREILGKKVKALRRRGLIPANVYGRNKKSIALQVEDKQFYKALTEGGRNAVINVKINGEKKARTAISRGLQRDPSTEELLHVDFFEVDVARRITAEVPIVLVGESPVAKGATAMISQSLGALEVEGLPTELPRSIDVDISGLAEIDEEIRVSDLLVPSNVSVLSDPDQLVVKVARGRISAEEEELAAAEAEEEEMAVEGEAPEAEATEPQAEETEAEQSEEEG